MKFEHTIHGMMCDHCENTIRTILGQLNCKNLKLSYKTGLLSYEGGNDLYNDINHLLKDTSYNIVKKKSPFVSFIKYALFIIIFLLLSKVIYNKFDVIRIDNPLALTSIFLFGLVTSLHCVGMCGGIAITQITTHKKQNIKNSLLYNAGRIITYSIIGGVLGAIGGTFNISGEFRTVMFFLIGTIMLLMGLNNLGIIRFRIQLPKIISPKLKGKNSLVVGIMNGFMPCGPLQTMQLLALSAGSLMGGVLVMFTFGIATVPLMFLFSNLNLLLPKKHYKKIAQLSSVLVIGMSILIFQQGFSSMGLTTKSVDELAFAPIVDGYQLVELTVDPYYYIEPLQVKKGVPVKLNIVVESVSGCTANIMVPKYDVNTDLMAGQSYELVFTPTESENLKITCWMSMVSTYLSVVE